jgi:hypothetical protein
VFIWVHLWFHRVALETVSLGSEPHDEEFVAKLGTGLLGCWPLELVCLCGFVPERKPWVAENRPGDFLASFVARATREMMHRSPAI